MGYRPARSAARAAAERWACCAVFLFLAAPWLIPAASARFRDTTLRGDDASPAADDATPYASVHIPELWVPIQTTAREFGDSGVRWSVTMCLVDWDRYWRAPHDAPKFTALQQKSGCGGADRRKEVKLADAAAAARKLGPPLKPSAFIFHESRVGSTLAANLLAAVPSHLVYSEGMRLPESRKASRAALREALQDYVALLGAPTTRDGARGPHAKLFVKFQSAVSARMADVLDAFPDVPWLFIHRDPVQVLMSHGARGFGRAVCVAKQRRTPKDVCALLDGCADAPPEDYCAAHLAHLCDGALAAAKAGHDGCGRVLEYTADMTAALVDDVFPHFFGVDVDDRARRAMVATSEKYSKGHETLLGAGRFNARADSDRKNRAATPAAQRAADAHLAPRHAALAALGRELDAKRACKA